jgi:hypothetical protein
VGSCRYPGNMDQRVTFEISDRRSSVGQGLNLTFA